MRTSSATDARLRRSPAGPMASVVVATRDRSERLGALLTALERQTVPAGRFEVLVVDDGSGDATPDVLATAAEHSPLDLHVFRHEVSNGPAAARNLGWRSAGADLIVFTDDDCEPVPQWLESLLAAAGDHPGAIVQGMVLPNPAEAQRASAFTRSLEVTGASPHYQTANILYPRATLEAVGGFDEQYGAPAGEDTDLGWRARAAGARTVFAPGALVHHAIHELGVRRTVRSALLASDCVKPYADHPELRAHLVQGIFFSPAHPLMAQALLGAVLARRAPAAALFALPYAVHVLRRARAAGSPAHHAPVLAARDVVEVVSTLRGAVRHRVRVL